MTARRPDPTFWSGRRVLVTGHTGFKGAWLCLMLSALGARVAGLALPAERPSLYNMAEVEKVVRARTVDVRSADEVRSAVGVAAPEIVFHLAAQSLVRRSVAQPTETYETNVLGTLNLLEALRIVPAFRTALVVTTDKVYRNDDHGRPFVESDAIGGSDPYAASKAACEIVTRSHATTYFDGAARLATARGGNVIGGGDFSEDRIIPDVYRALSSGSPLTLRSPDATRPWQHVLDCLTGYLLYAEALTVGEDVPETLNFGPPPEAPFTVAEIVQRFCNAVGVAVAIEIEPSPIKEAALLSLDASAARRTLGWEPRYDTEAAIERTAEWYRRLREGEGVPSFTRAEVQNYLAGSDA